MAQVAHQTSFSGSPRHFQPVAAAAEKPLRQMLRKVIGAIMPSRERETQRDIDRIVAWRDGGFNDSFEREIAESFYSDGWNFRR